MFGTQTILPTKVDNEVPMARNDEHLAAMTADPSIPQFGTGIQQQQPLNTNTFGGSITQQFGTSQQQNNFGQQSTTQDFNNANNAGTMNSNMSMSNSPVLTGAGMNAAMDGESLIQNTNEDWINRKWRPMMGVMYFVVCITDFIVFPVLWSLLQAHDHGVVTSQWQPLTLQGGGLFHVALGTILGVAAFGRTREKIAGVN